MLVTSINAWACWQIQDENGGDLLFLDGPPPGSRYKPAAVQGARGSSRREFLRLAGPVIVIGSSPWWAPKALALASTRSNQVLAFMSGTPVSNALSSGAVVTSVTFSPDGRTLAFGTTDGLVELWDVTNPARPAPPGQPLTGQDGVSSVAFSPDGRTLASGSGDTTIQLWDVADRARPAALGRPLQARHEVSSLAFSPDGRTLAASSNDGDDRFGVGAGDIELWDVADRARPAALGRSRTSAEGYSAVAFSPSRRTLASGNMLGVVQLWDVADPARPAVLASLRTSAASGYTFVAFGPRGHILAGGGNGVIQLWDVADPARPAALGAPLAIADEVSSLAFSPDGRTLASGSDGGGRGYSPGSVQLWDVADRTRPAALGRPLS